MSSGGGLGASAAPPGGSSGSGPLGDRYTVVNELGRGGFGQTYLAKDRHRYDELCVVKEFVPQVEDKAMLAKAKELFEREASVLYQLDHKQIPEFRQLLEVESETGGRLFIVQDYEAGPTYQSLLEDRQRFGGKFTETEITQLLYQLLPVLSYIHGLGLVHRDISPDNLILRQTDGLPVLIDFGSVKEIAAAVRSQLAIEGVGPAPTRIGKAGYVPLEQLSTGNANPASDLYGLAATLLVLATGENPQMLHDPHHGTWSGSESLSPKLAQILKRMLAANPEDRYPSAAAVLAALKGNMQGNVQGGGAAGSTATVVDAPVGVDGEELPPVNSEAMYPPVGTAGAAGFVMGAAGAAGAAMRGMTGDPPEVTPEYENEAMLMSDVDIMAGSADIDTEVFPGGVRGIDSAADEAEVYTPDIRPDPRAIGKPDPRQALLGLLVMLGLVGSLLALAFMRFMNTPNTSDGTASAGASGDTEVIAVGDFSREEAARKQEIRSRREGLGVSGEYFIRLVDQLFYQEYPELNTSGPNGGRKTLSSAPMDEPLRIRWDHIAMGVLDQLEGNFSQRSVRALGSYSSESQGTWESQLNQVNVGTRALFDLVDAKFFNLFADQSGRDFLNRPIGQLYYALADDNARAIESGNAREVIEFENGAFRRDVSGELVAGAGKVYTMSLSAGQLLRLNLAAPAESTQISLYPPEPTDDMPAVFADSEQTTWSGSVTQSGVYELVVINRFAEPVNYQLAVSVDNVISDPPVAPPKEEPKEEDTAEVDEVDESTETDNSETDASETDSTDAESSVRIDPLFQREIDGRIEDAREE